LFFQASNLAQSPGIAALSELGRIENQEIIDFYIKNDRLGVLIWNCLKIIS